MMLGTILKTETLNLRISPTTKSALRFIADRERRSMSNMIDMLVTVYLANNGLPPPGEKQGLKIAQSRNGNGNAASTRTKRKDGNDT